MSRTIFLGAIAVALVLMQFFPSHATLIKWAVFILGALFLVVRALLTYPALFRERRRRAAQRDADARAFREYEKELAELRAQRDPGSAAETAALTVLHDKYGAMLKRKFGPH